MNKKTLAITASVLIIILLGVGAYVYFTKKPGVSPQQTGIAFPGEGQPVMAPIRGTTTQGGGGATSFTPGSSAPLPRLYELHKTPVAGAGFTEAGKGSTHTIATRYIERSLGNIFETPLSTYVEARIVRDTRSRIAEALWGNNGKSVVIRSVDDDGSTIKTHVVNIANALAAPLIQSTSTEGLADSFLQTEEVFLPDYIPFLAVAEDDTDKIFYLENSDVAAAGSVTGFRRIGSTGIFNSSFTEWLPQFPDQNLVTLTTRPSVIVPGYLFFLNTKTKALTKVLSDINGLTTLTNHDGTKVLYSKTVEGAPLISLFDTTKKVTTGLAIETLPEKCVWGKKEKDVVYCAVPDTLPTATYPDQWYQGLFSFSDSLWKIDAKTGASQKVFTPSDLGAPSLDMINLALSSDDSYLLFMNKVTGTPWVFRFAEEAPVVAATTPMSATTTTIPSTPLEGMQKLK